MGLEQDCGRVGSAFVGGGGSVEAVALRRTARAVGEVGGSGD